MKQKFTNEDLSIFCSQLSMILHSGISVLEGISILYEDAPEGGEKQILETVNTVLMETGELAPALRDSGAFPEYMIHMVEIGERSGTLDEVMDSLGDHYEREDAISRTIHDALIYPLIMIFMLLSVLAVLIVQVMPVFQQVFQQLGMELSGAANALYLLGQKMRQYSCILVLLILLLAADVFLVLRLPNWRTRLISSAEKLPIFRNISILLACSRFSGAMARALKSGLDVDESFRLASNLVEQPDFKAKVLLAAEKIHEGEDFSEALRQTGIYSGLNARMISVGFRTGSTDAALEKISISCQEEADTRIQNMVSALEPAIVAVLSVLTGLILLSVMLPLLSIMSGIG
ncbi:MAG: type II secretion system F family protein [Lachnospiraceae bacterium]|nr:type II secretion system F family protein [Lachnospiraceae bacterium]